MQTATHHASATPTRSSAICRASAASFRCTSTAAGGLRPTGGTRELLNPANGRAIALRRRSDDRADAEAAIAAARRAFDEGPWSSISAADRAALLFKVADAIDAHRDEFMRIDTLNNGKPLRETEYDADRRGQLFSLLRRSRDQAARSDLRRAGALADVHGARADRRLRTDRSVELSAAHGDVEARAGVGRRQRLRTQAGGADAALGDSAWRRSSSELEFPPGVVNIVLGAGATVGHAIAASPLVDKIAFTGGTKTGRSIMHDATTNLKKISLELGGKSPNVVFADADFDTAVDYALFGIFANAGQVCSAGSRLIVERSLHDRFVERLVERAQKIRVGDGFDPQTEMGPIISPIHRERVEAYIERAERRARSCSAAATGSAAPLADGNFIAPTIFDEHLADDAHRPGRDLRPRARRADFRRRSRGDRIGKRHDLRFGRRGLHSRHRESASRDPQDARRHHVDQHLSSDV